MKNDISYNLGEFFLGDCIKITSTLDTAPTCVKISVWDGAGVKKVDNQSMSPVSTLVYDYSFQSLSAWAVGKVIIKTTATTSTNENIQEDYVILYPLEH